MVPVWKWNEKITMGNKKHANDGTNITSPETDAMKDIQVFNLDEARKDAALNFASSEVRGSDRC